MEFSNSLSLIAILSLIVSIILYFLASEKNLRLSILWLSLFSILTCILYLVMDAPDVAMTEAALGTCLTTIILLKCSAQYSKDSSSITSDIDEDDAASSEFWRKAFALVLCSAFGIALIYSGLDLQKYGVGNSPVQNGAQEYYNSNTMKEIGIPSFVAAILASYRGYDTLGETSVIFIAGICIIMIKSRKEFYIRDASYDSK